MQAPGMLVAVLGGAATLASAGPAVAASHAVGRCRIPTGHPPEDQVFYGRLTPKIIMIERYKERKVRGGYAVTRGVYRSCWRATGKQRVVFSGPPVDGLAPVISWTAGGEWLVISTFTSQVTFDPKVTGMIWSFNVRNGRHGPVVRQVGGLVDGSGGRIPFVGDRDPLAITTDGEYAWVTERTNTAGPYPPVIGLLVPDGNGGDRLIDPAQAGEITRLRSHGKTITWLKQGVAKSMLLG